MVLELDIDPEDPGSNHCSVTKVPGPVAISQTLLHRVDVRTKRRKGTIYTTLSCLEEGQYTNKS